jgi:hypothetical protein
MKKAEELPRPNKGCKSTEIRRHMVSDIKGGI